MTTLIAWVGVDSRTPSSFYIASDSRISWGRTESWDTGKKLFSSKTMPEMFGYCGYITFPAQVLAQVIEKIDSNVLFFKNEDYQSKLNKVHSIIKDSFSSLPETQKLPFEIIYASRIGSRMGLEFKVSRIYLTPEKTVAVENVCLPEKSGLIIGTGTGWKSLKRWYKKWVEPIPNDPNERTRVSRNIFGAFCDSLQAKEDQQSGGAPQLIGLYRVGPAKTFGIIYGENRYLAGSPVDVNEQLHNIEWRNCLFERCDGDTMCIINGAQIQPRPSHAESRS